MPLPAAAGPWEPQGDGQTIAQVWLGEEDGRSETEAQIYRESLGPLGTQVMKLWAQDDTLGRAIEATLALRRHVAVPGTDAAAIEGAVIAITREGADPALEGGNRRLGWLVLGPRALCLG